VLETRETEVIVGLDTDFLDFLDMVTWCRRKWTEQLKLHDGKMTNNSNLESNARMTPGLHAVQAVHFARVKFYFTK